ncbi:hypothetical protein BC833DRAFT_528280 [Globomyces pollinis-pini]|nr:hypothetical protein BC833DRAFT_528280 [Globomyces pollinis-pini]
MLLSRYFIKTRSFHSNKINLFINSTQLSLQKDPYSVLGVDKNATSSQIKKAYYQLAKEYHPDTNKDPSAKEKFLEIQNSYEILTDENKKAHYDQFGHDPDPSTGGFNNGFNGFGGFGGNGFNGGGFSGNPFEDLFSQFGGAQRESVGSDISTRLQISFLDAAKGIEKEISYRPVVSCTPCKGSGAKPGTTPKTCPQCRGAGQVLFQQGVFTMKSECPSCGGKGTTIPSGSKCTSCSGQGRVREKKNITVKIPAGIDDGMTVRLSGQGDAAESPNGRKGDLLIQVNIARHDRFKRDGANVLLDVNVPLITAILGGSITIPTIDGNVDLKIPPGTQPNDRKTLKNRGMPRINSRQKGDQWITLKVELPKSISTEQKELLMKAFGTPENAEQHSEGEDKGFFSKIFGKDKEQS